jgi:transposase
VRNIIQGEENMGKKGLKHRAYTQEFKTEAVALAEKREKPVSQIAKDLGINDNMLRKWMQQTREAAGTAIRVFPGHGRTRDAELTKLRRENKQLKEASD